MELLEALYTTRAMRRVRPNPVPPEVQARLLDAAIRAPSGGNSQNWRFILVDSPQLKAELGPLYRDSLSQLWATVYAERLSAARTEPEDPENASMLRIQRSAQWLGDHYEQVPLYMFAFVQHDPTGGSIFPAVWSAQLAARSEGVGSSLTSVLGFFHGDEVARLLAVPAQGWVNACMVSFGYPTGRWAVAQRRPVAEVAGRNSWTGDLGLEIPAPLWPPGAG